MRWRDVNPAIRAALTILWGLWILLPWNTLPSTPSFDFIETLSPNETVWGFLVMTCGLLQAAQLRYRQRTLLLAPALVWWTFIAIGVGIANPSAPAWITYAAVAALAAAHYIRALEERERGGP